MRQQLPYAVVIHQRLLVGIVYRSLHLLVLDLLAYLLGELRCKLADFAHKRSDDTSFERTAYEGDISDKVKEFVACRLILMCDGSLIEIAEFRHILSCHTHKVGKMVKLALLHRGVIDYYGVVKISSLYEIVLHKGLYFSNEHKCSA